MGVEVINFTKATGTAPVTQNISHNLGETPKFAIFMGIAKTGTGFGGGYISSFGFTDGSGNGSLTFADQNGVTTMNNNRGCSSSHCILFTNESQTVLASAAFSSWNSSQISILWGVNNSSAYHCSVILVSGNGVSAKVVSWTQPTSTGNKAVTGVGFVPEGLIHLTAHLVGSATGFASAIGSLGMVGTGGSSYVQSIRSSDAVSTSVCARGLYQKTTHIHSDTTTQSVSNHVSFDSDGFTNNFTTVTGSATLIVTLAFKGLQIKAGVFDKSTDSAPASQAVTGVGFSPGVLMFLCSTQTALDTIGTHVKNVNGFVDTDTIFASTRLSEHGVGTSNTDGCAKTDKCLVIANNHTPTIDAEASLTSLDSDGFTLSWTTNDASAYKIAYLALADSTNKDVSDSATLVESVGFPTKDIWLDETATLAELIFLGAIELLDQLILNDSVEFPVKSVWLNEVITVTDAQSLIFKITDRANFVDTITVSTLIDLAEQLNLNENIVLAVAVALTETINVQDKLGRLATLTDTITVIELLEMLLDKPFTDGGQLGESISIRKSEDVEFEEPDEVYFARGRNRLVSIEKMKKLN